MEADFAATFNTSVLTGLVLIIGSIVVLSVLLALDIIAVIGLALITALAVGLVIIGSVHAKCPERKTAPVM